MLQKPLQAMYACSSNSYVDRLLAPLQLMFPVVNNLTLNSEAIVFINLAEEIVHRPPTKRS